MTIAEWKEKGANFQYNNHHIFFVKEGRGPYLLLLHGFPTASWDWHKIWPHLTEQFTLIAPDFMGFGLSAKPIQYNYSLMDQTDMCINLLTHLKVNDFHLMTHDYADSIAQELLARQNEGSLTTKILSTTLLNGGLFPGVHKPRLIQKLLMTPIGPLLGRLYKKKNLRKTFGDIFGKNTPPSEEEIDTFWKLIEMNDGRKVVHKLIRYMAERVTHQDRWKRALQESVSPIRLIDGAADPISGIHLVEHYRKVVPNPDCVVLEGIGHYPQVEAPEAVLKAFYEFVNLPRSEPSPGSSE